MTKVRCCICKKELKYKKDRHQVTVVREISVCMGVKKCYLKRKEKKYLLCKKCFERVKNFISKISYDIQNR